MRLRVRHLHVAHVSYVAIHVQRLTSDATRFFRRFFRVIFVRRCVGNGRQGVSPPSPLELENPLKTVRYPDHESLDSLIKI